jgi:hypothetical protein
MNRPGKSREFQFVPRVINPVKMTRACIFAADSEIRETKALLEECMPWLKTEVFFDPQSVVTSTCDRPAVFLFDDTALALVDAEEIRALNKDAVIVLLTYHVFIQRSPPQAARQKYPYTAKADLVFAVNRNELKPQNIVPAVVRAAEDLINIEKYSEVRRFIFHLVDDEPRWFSEFLPLLYNIIGQRADVMISRTWEDSLRFIFGVDSESEINKKSRVLKGHGDDVVCLITDIFFPRGSDLQSDAGQDLIRLVGRSYPRIPVIIASKAKEALALKDLGFVLPKGDPGSLEKLKDYILNFTGMGDFLILDQEGRELDRIKDIYGLCRILLEAEKDSPQGQRLQKILEHYGENDKFSTWLYMHSYSELGDRLRPKRGRGRQLITLLKRHFEREIIRLRRTPLIIDGEKIFDLPDLEAALQRLDPDKIQPYSNNDIISSWLDRKGYPELAEELRPIHGSGLMLSQTLTQIIKKWMRVYQERQQTR